MVSFSVGLCGPVEVVDNRYVALLIVVHALLTALCTNQGFGLFE